MWQYCQVARFECRNAAISIPDDIVLSRDRDVMRNAFKTLEIARSQQRIVATYRYIEVTRSRYRKVVVGDKIRHGSRDLGAWFSEPAVAAMDKPGRGAGQGRRVRRLAEGEVPLTRSAGRLSPQHDGRSEVHAPWGLVFGESLSVRRAEQSRSARDEKKPTTRTMRAASWTRQARDHC